jgi:glycosyltransferase involved in cell wall biosynthesis
VTATARFTPTVAVALPVCPRLARAPRASLLDLRHPTFRSPSASVGHRTRLSVRRFETLVLPLPSRPPGPFTVLSVGRLVPEKRHDVVLEGVRRSKHASELRVVIVGKGPMRPALEQQAQGHPARVEIGYQPDEELLRLYQTADLYVHASEVELEGLAALEAMPAPTR